jgi:hypothetical protein
VATREPFRSEWAIDPTTGKHARWKGGRYYFDELKRKVFFIEKMVRKERYVIRLATHDEDFAVGELARFMADPVGYKRALDDAAKPEPAPAAVPTGTVFITADRLKRYMESISHTVTDHQNARSTYLANWSALGLDLSKVDRDTLRAKLDSFSDPGKDKRRTGGLRGRAEALNAFARFLVKEGDLKAWPHWIDVNKVKPNPKSARADRVAYSVEELIAAYRQIPAEGIRAFLVVRVMTGMHGTEIEQLAGCKLTKGPLPDTGAGIRDLGDQHEVRGVLQTWHKSRRRHRISVDEATLAAALHLHKHGVPNRVTVWEVLGELGITASNCRHTFDTLAGEIGQRITYKAAGVDRSFVAQVMGHRAGSTQGPDRYEKAHVPPMLKLPIAWPGAI